MSLRDSLVKLVQNNDDFSPFYNSTSDMIYKNNKLKEENAAHEKAVTNLKLKYNQGQITKEQFDSDMQALLNKQNKTNVVDTTKLNVKVPADSVNKTLANNEYNAENKAHKEKLNTIENTNSDEAIKAAKTKYDKTKAELQEKLNNETITQEQYDEQLSQADEAFKNATGMSYNESTWVNMLDTAGAHAVGNAARKASNAYTNASNAASNSSSIGGVYGNMSNVGVSPDGYSTGLRAQAQEDVRQAGDEQRNMQQNFQIANRNYRDEAGRDAAMKAASQNAQKVNNAAAGVGSGAAAMLRDVVTPDTQTYMNRQDAQRKEGVENQRQMHAAQQEAIRRNTDANGYDYVIADANRYNAAVGALSNNNAKTDDRGETKDTTKDTEPTDTVDPLEGYSSADLRNLQALLSNEYIKSAHPQTGDGNPETGDYKFYPNTTDNTEVAPTDLSETYTFAQLKESNPEYAQRLLNIYNSLKRMLANPQTRAAIYSRAKANAPSDYTIAATSKDAEIDDMHLLQDYISSTENNTTRKKGGTTADEARRQGTVTNESNINLNPNVTAALNSNMRS